MTPSLCQLIDTLVELFAATNSSIFFFLDNPSSDNKSLPQLYLSTTNPELES